MLILVSLSLAKSLALSAFSAHFYVFFINFNFSPKSFFDNTNLISLSISFKCTGASASIVFDNSLTGLQMSGLLGLVKYSIVPTPLLYVSCSSGLTLSSGFYNLLAVNLGVPGVRDSLSFMALSPNFCSKLLIIDGCSNHPLGFLYSYGAHNLHSLQGCVGSSLRIPHLFLWQIFYLFHLPNNDHIINIHNDNAHPKLSFLK